MTKIQLTVRNIPSRVDGVIRKHSKQSGKSFSKTVISLFTLRTFGTIEAPSDASFDWLYNKNTLDNKFDEAIGALSQIDEKLWQ